MNVKSHHTTKELQTFYRIEKKCKTCSENIRGISGRQRINLPSDYEYYRSCSSHDSAVGT